MKKFITLLGFVIPVTVVIFAVFYAVIVYQGAGVDEESKAYVDKVTPVILAAMNRQTLFKYADDKLINSATPDEIDRIFNWFGSLGELRKYDGASGNANVSFSTSGISFTANYEAKATFDKGEAVIKVSTIRRGGEWKISAFSIRSSALPRSSY
ncbi:MAG: hypothetical protein LJE83_02900 [Gammaproteobacteria bacterium]|jgi:hypothetical protein|nr:hypothetical protein [Gammaproteobacteria bacterium]